MSDMVWPCFRHTLDMFQTRFWKCFRHGLDMFQTCAGHVLDMDRSCWLTHLVFAQLRCRVWWEYIEHKAKWSDGPSRRGLECELCKTAYPCKIRSKDGKKTLNLLEYDTPQSESGEDLYYMVLEPLDKIGGGEFNLSG